MLIECERHRPDDLAHWRMLEAGDLMYARANARRLDRLVAESLRFMRDFSAAGPCYQGVSWGKDSVVLAAIGARGGVRVPLVHVYAPGYETPFNSLVRDEFLSAFDVDYHEIAVDVLPGSEAHEGEHGRHDAGYAEASRRFGDRYISGVRRDESRARNLRYFGHGVNSARTSAPLSNWRSEDVFAFCARERLPLHPSYAMTLGGRFDRRQIRVSSVGHLRGVDRGQREWEMVYYRDELAAQGRDHRRIG